MNILVIINGNYGARHFENIKKHGPKSWNMNIWKAPATFPLVIDYPEDYLPEEFAPADLLLAFGEHRGCVELIPDIAEMTGTNAVIAPIDNESWLPRGLANQLHGWLKDINVNCVTPKPLCSLTEHDYMVTRNKRISYVDTHISEFAHHFGQPDIKLSINPETRTIIGADVVRDSFCGCARHVAQGIVGTIVDEAQEKAGLLHHHYPCLASMGKDIDFGDTLMHVSGNIIKDNIDKSIKQFKQTRYFEPGKRSNP